MAGKNKKGPKKPCREELIVLQGVPPSEIAKQKTKKEKAKKMAKKEKKKIVKARKKAKKQAKALEEAKAAKEAKLLEEITTRDLAKDSEAESEVESQIEFNPDVSISRLEPLDRVSLPVAILTHESPVKIRDPPYYSRQGQTNKAADQPDRFFDPPNQVH